mgnify:FL=1
MPAGINTQYYQEFQSRQLNCIFTTYSKRRTGIGIIDVINTNGVCIRLIYTKHVTGISLFYATLLPTDT